jgi:hypothetical protein
MGQLGLVESSGCQKSKATRLAAVDTAACGGTRADVPSAAKHFRADVPSAAKHFRADVPSAAKHKLHYFPEGQ